MVARHGAGSLSWPSGMRYAPGTFSRAELATSVADAAKGLYAAAVFGREYGDNPIGDGHGLLDGAARRWQPVAALFGCDQSAAWNRYATVESADAAAAQASEHGRRRRRRRPFDVMDVGRMAVIADPAGAALARGSRARASAPSSPTPPAR